MNANKFREHLLGLFLLISALLHGCAPTGPLPIADGQVVALAEQTTVAGIYSVLNGAQPFGEVWVNGSQSVVAWPQSGGWAWACLRFNCDGWLGYFKFSAHGNANVANWKTFSDLTGYLRQNGWTKLPSAALPTALTAGQSVSGFLTQMAGAVTGFMIVPIVPQNLPTEVQG